MTKAADAFRTISEVADDLGIPKHVLRFWEAKFAQIRPMKRGGGRRYYRPEDLELLKGIQQLLHRDGYTIKGVQKILREQGVDAVKLRNLASSVSSSAGAAAVPIAPAPGMAGGEKAKTSPRAQKGGRSAAVSKQAPTGSPPSRSTVIAQAIAELEACRALLSGAGKDGTIVSDAKLGGGTGSRP